MTDRNPTYPGRVCITDELTNESRFATIEMADEPLDDGTPPIKVNLLDDDTQAMYPKGTDTVNLALRHLKTVPAPIELGGTGANTAAHALRNLCYYMNTYSNPGVNDGLVMYRQRGTTLNDWSVFKISFTEFAKKIMERRTATGLYTGTGTFGQDSPNQLTFDFAPKILIVTEILDYSSENYDIPMILMPVPGKTTVGSWFGSMATTYSVRCTLSGNTVIWYCNMRHDVIGGNESANANGQKNENGYKYAYFAIG